MTADATWGPWTRHDPGHHHHDPSHHHEHPRHAAEHLRQHLHQHLQAARHHRGRPFGPGGFGPGRGFAAGGPWAGWFGHGRRAGRGDIRAAILALLAETPMHGYQIIQELTSRSGGAWRPSPGSVYPTLQQLEDEGLVIARPEQDTGRRVYELTAEGRAQAGAAGAGPAPWDEAAGALDTDVTSLRDLLFQVGAATLQVGHAGTRGQLVQAQEILRDARRRLYQLLAEDGSEETSSAE